MVKKVVRKQKGGIGGFTPLRIGGRKKNPRQAKPGYDQEFTLPRGTSAAPIKQVRATTASGDKVFGGGKSVWSGVKHKDAKKHILDPAKKAYKKANRIPTSLHFALGTGFGIAGVSSLREHGRREEAKSRKEAQKSRQRRARTKSRASQRGVKKRP